jgi:hypothetical protein
VVPAATAYPQVPPDADRIFTTAAETRLIALESEARTFTPAAETRTGSTDT